MILLGIIGVICISLGLWIKREVLQNIIFILGGICLLLYGIYQNDVIFIVLQVIFIFSALLEFLKIKKVS